MKVLVVHNQYQQAGGEKAAVAAQIGLLRQHGHEVLVYSRDNLEIERFNTGQKVAFLAETLWSQRTYHSLRTLLAAEKPDIAHVHNVFPLISPSVYKALKDAHVPVVQTIHNFRFLCPNGLFYTHGAICERCKRGNTLHAVRWNCYHNSRILSALYALTIGLHRAIGTFDSIGRFIALTDFSAQKLVESGFTQSEKVTILGNFLGDPLPEPGTNELRKPYLIFIGRLSPEKGVDVLLETVGELPGLGLIILGDGPLLQPLQTLAGQNHWANVTFKGRVDGIEKWQYLRQALACVLPSVWYENFPIALLESFAAATPVVASHLGSFPYLITEGQTGLLFHPGDRTDLRSKLAWLVDHPDRALEMGHQCRQMLVENYSAEAQYDHLIAIYHQLGV